MDTKPTDELPAIPDLPSEARKASARERPVREWREIHEEPHDANQGEGDRVSARAYDHDLRSFIDEGRVPQAARQARAFVEHDPIAAAKAEREAKHGPRGHLATVDELVARGRSVVDRVVDKVRHAIKK
jgi:hypothetical protein